MLNEKKLTPAEKKKREEIARAIERENPDMPMDKKMAIATATAIKVAEAMDDTAPARVQRTGDFKLVKYRDPNTGKIRWRKQKKEFEVESVQEAKDMYRSAAQELKSYADKHGGMDKKDFHTAAKHIENIGSANILNKGQHLAKFSKHLRDLDTSPREKVLSVLHKHGHEVGDYMPGVKMKKRVREEVQEGSPTRLDMIRKAAEKYNKQKKAAERKAERDAKKAMSKDADLVGENNNAPQTAAHRRAMMGPPKTKKDKPPFEGPYTKASEPKKDKFGNTIKVQNIAKHLAKKAAAQQTDESVSEEYTNQDYLAGKKTVKVKSGDRAGETGRVISRTNKDGKIHFTVKHGDNWYEPNSSTHPGSNLEIHEAVHPDHVSLHPHKTDKKKYTVGQVGRNVKGRLKTGEHLNDTEVDDLHDMGMKVKHERKPLREADFDTNFKKRIALKVSGPKSVRDYMKTKVDQHKAAHAKQDPSAVKQGYGPGVIPPGTAFRAAMKRGMNPSQAANAVSNAMKNRGKPRKLPEETELHEGVIDTLNTIVKSRGAQEVKFKNGQKTKVDVQTANVLTKVHKSLNSTNAKKFADKLGKSQGDFMKLLDFAYTVTR